MDCNDNSFLYGKSGIIEGQSMVSLDNINTTRSTETFSSKVTS